MNNGILKLNQLKSDGQLYYDTQLDKIEALIPNSCFSSCHAADLLELPNGDLLCCWFAGSEEGKADVSIVISRLKAGECVWSEPIKVSDDPQRSEQNPSLFFSPNGEIWLIYTAQIARTPENNPYYSLQSTAEIRCKKSLDNGYTWGKTEVLFSRPGSFCRQKIQVLTSGRWIFGNWICFADHTHNGSDIPVVYISDDQGNTWKEKKIPNSEGRVHANLIEIQPGKLIALFRSRFADNIYLSVSQDEGETWSEPKRTLLPNNNSSISAIKLHSGGLALVYNAVGFNGKPGITLWPDQRCPIEAAISEDEGNTWPFRRVVEFGEGFTGQWNDINNQRYEYPVIMQGKDGRIHIAYTWGSRKNIKYVCVDEAWIRGKKVCYGAENMKEFPCMR